MEILQTLKRMLELQQDQNGLLWAGVTRAQETVEHALMGLSSDHASTKVGNVSDFQRLRPSNFSGNEMPLEKEQWLIKMEQLLNVAKISEEDWVDVVSIQLTDAAEMERLTPPISWKSFSESFLVKFFPMTTKAKMEQQFINLNQEGRTVDQYATNLLD